MGSYWPDLSRYKNNGRIYGAELRHGMMWFNGDDYIQTALQYIPPEGTVLAWCITSSSNRQNIAWTLFISGQHFRFNVNYKPGVPGSSPGYLGVCTKYGVLSGYTYVGNVIYNGEPHFWGFSWKNDELRIFFDGEEKPVTYIHKDVFSGAKCEPLRLGGTAYYLVGYIGEFFFLDKAIGVTEYKILYQLTSPYGTR